MAVGLGHAQDRGLGRVVVVVIVVAGVVVDEGVDAGGPPEGGRPVLTAGRGGGTRSLYSAGQQYSHRDTLPSTIFPFPTPLAYTFMKRLNPRVSGTQDGYRCSLNTLRHHSRTSLVM